MDFGLRADYGRLRAGANGFYAWIHKYITLEATDTTGALLPNNGLDVHFVNTDQATLAGGELYGEFDLSDYITPFATMSYVEGRDQTRDHRGFRLPRRPLPGQTFIPGLGALGSPQEPLPGIPPLEARIGFRVHEASRNPRWGVEFTARIVDEQDRFAESLAEVGTPGFTIYDVRSYWQANQTLLLTAGVENMGDKNYREHLDLRTGVPLGPGVLQPGVNFYFGAQLTY